ncbi:hypothetical protein [Cellulomonas fimi]|uniref:hypothetical protein n=1 Tax=Cellulomonas fimi TaxID=1708 RepID=UPI002358880F|nr:hypothetical protein [Cellulomonas fimi]
MRFAVELERAIKEQADYDAVVAAYRDAGLPQVWHVLSARTAERLAKAAQRAGFQWAPSPTRGVNVSTDGLFRMQGWRSGRVLSNTASWAPRLNFPASFPAALDAYVFPQKLDAWRGGTIVDPSAEPLWEPLPMYDAAA